MQLTEHAAGQALVAAGPVVTTAALTLLSRLAAPLPGLSQAHPVGGAIAGGFRVAATASPVPKVGRHGLDDGVCR